MSNGIFGRCRNHFKIGIVVLVTALFWGCDSSDTPKVTVEGLSFEVVDSLLGDTITVGEAGIYVVAPATYIIGPDTSLERLQRIQSRKFPDHDLIAIYIDSTAIAALLISIIHDLNLAADTTQSMATYRKTLSENYGDSSIKTGEFLINDVLVKNSLIMDEAWVRFHLLCLTYGKPAADIEYITAKQDYAKLLKSIESSMGTIQTSTKEVYE